MPGVTKDTDSFFTKRAALDACEGKKDRTLATSLTRGCGVDMRLCWRPASLPLPGQAEGGVGYFLQEVETIFREVTVRWPCSVSSFFMCASAAALLASSFMLCAVAFFTTPCAATVCPT